MSENPSGSLTVISITPSDSDDEELSSDSEPPKRKLTVHFDEEHEPKYYRPAGLPFKDQEARDSFIKYVLICGAVKYAFCAGFTAVCLFVIGIFDNFFFSHYSMTIGVPCLTIAIILGISVAFCKFGRGNPDAVNITTYIVSVLLWSLAFGIFAVYLKSAVVLVALTTNCLIFSVLAIAVSSKSPTNIDALEKFIWKIIPLFAIFIFAGLATIFILGIIHYTDIDYLKLYDKEKWAKAGFAITTVFMCLYSAFLPLAVYLKLKSVVRHSGGQWQFTEKDWLIFSVRCFY